MWTLKYLRWRNGEFSVINIKIQCMEINIYIIRYRTKLSLDTEEGAWTKTDTSPSAWFEQGQEWLRLWSTKEVGGEWMFNVLREKTYESRILYSVKRSFKRSAPLGSLEFRMFRMSVSVGRRPGPFLERWLVTWQPLEDESKENDTAWTRHVS